MAGLGRVALPVPGAAPSGAHAAAPAARGLGWTKALRRFGLAVLLRAMLLRRRIQDPLENRLALFPGLVAILGIV